MHFVVKTFVFFVILSVDVHNQRACFISHQLLPCGAQTAGRGVGSTFLSPVQTDAVQSQEV